MVAADAVVSMGGYNTICEILSLGTGGGGAPHRAGARAVDQS